MKTINFKSFKTFTDITQEHTTESDIRREFADLMYKNMNGIVAHDLALRIYRSEGPIELTEEEINLIREFISNGTPIFQDSFESNIKEK